MRTAYATFVKAFYDVDPEATCSMLTVAARKHIGSLGDGKPLSCREKIATQLDLREFSEHRPYVVGVRIRDDRAIARVKTKTSKAYQIPLAKVDGEWKLDAAP